ncbi:GL22581 [Drosophila persimilis]|uniref:GL22581 n=1 Tax=Drosophila persimilis TaxID=7234 RepID=B4H1B2_DROPE|nr:GL22581 [Drosophila persimilis]
MQSGGSSGERNNIIMVEISGRINIIGRAMGQGGGGGLVGAVRTVEYGSVSELCLVMLTWGITENNSSNKQQQDMGHEPAGMLNHSPRIGKQGEYAYGEWNGGTGGQEYGTMDGMEQWDQLEWLIPLLEQLNGTWSVQKDGNYGTMRNDWHSLAQHLGTMGERKAGTSDRVTVYVVYGMTCSTERRGTTERREEYRTMGTKGRRGGTG